MEILGYFFLAHNNKRAWQELSKQTTKDEYNKLKNIFDIFTKKFNKIWKIEKTNIANASKLLATELKEKKYKELEKDLALLFNKKNNKKKIKIFILIRPKQIKGLTGGGHANYGEDLISLEASDLSKKNISRTNKILMVYFHELIHIIYSHPYYNNLIVKFLNKVPKKNFNESRLYKIVKSYYIIIDEALISALLPDGILAEKYFEHNIKKAFLTHFPDGKPDANQKSSLRAWKIYSSYKIKRNLNEYLKAGKKIDMDLLEYLYKIFQEFNNLKKA